MSKLPIPYTQPINLYQITPNKANNCLVKTSLKEK